MSDVLSQQGRVASLSTPLGQDKLVLSRFEGSEGLSELFEFRVECLSTDDNVDFDQVLGLSSTVKMTFYAGPDRYFDGITVEAQSLGIRQDLFVYRIVLRPSLWLTTRTTNCRIWHDTNALDIIKEVLGDDSVNYRDATTKSYPSLEYCVQYRETDFAFVSRLMEQHGIYYFFEHSEGSHTMVLADALSSHKPVQGYATIRFAPSLAAGHVQEQTLNNWSSERRFRTGKIELRDYNFKQPNANMTADVNGHESYNKSQMEFYDYPGKYDNVGDGDTYAQVRLDAEQAIDHRRYAAGIAPNLFPGALTTVTDHPIDSENQQYLLVRCSHYYVTEAYRSAGAIAIRDDRPYHGDYEMQPSDRVFRAPIVTPKPTVYGPHTARVVTRPGNDGEEIDVDDDGYGRIRVHFFWDRDDKRSCWIRVAQMWAGPLWGGQFIPRIGMEVVVDFLEGDPDRPMIVGAVYNGANGYP
ncbi:MAG TPA: type VI secretion system tip protein TssI/VgrG, partial [Beijerinckiaceae bacterium]|nr:type VI secretion system tip protein TssI/VgrG [Beijerinckiaceae bacterium]